MNNADISELVVWRKNLHRYPEVSGEEQRTAENVRARLAALAPDALVTGLGGHGVLAQFRGEDARVRVLLRCELDGLPIVETNDFAHRSSIPGKGHLCGHDGHMAILMGVARALSAARMRGVDALLLFQPAEETGAGAEAVLNDPNFADFRPDLAVALHNVPGLPLGEVRVKPGPACCASRGLRMSLTGRTAHASQPETGLSPAGAMLEIIQGIGQLGLPGAAGELPRRMATLTHARLGEPTFGVAPGAADIYATLRTVHDADMHDLCARTETLSRTACDRAGLGLDMTWHDVFPAVVNDPGLVDLITAATASAGIACRPQDQPMRWSEDFGRFGAVARSAIFLLGAGETTPALHNPDYDFPDDLIPVGTRAFLSILKGVGPDI